MPEEKEILPQPIRRPSVIATLKMDDTPSHEHQWDLILKTYAPPKPEFVSENLDSATTEKLLFGVTVLLWKCVLCSETKKEEVIGTDENQLNEILGKVLNYGPQYVQEDGVTFVIAKWQPTTSAAGLPIR